MVVEFTFSVLKALLIYACQERYLVEELCIQVFYGLILCKLSICLIYTNNMNLFSGRFHFIAGVTIT